MFTDIHISVSEYGFKSMDETPPATIYPVRVMGKDKHGHRWVLGLGEEVCLWDAAAQACAQAAKAIGKPRPKPTAKGTLWEFATTNGTPESIDAADGLYGPSATEDS